MTLLHEEHARAHHAALLADAQRFGEGQRVARATRLSRKAERAAQAARLALARAL